jgi:hypothetical protein
MTTNTPPPNPPRNPRLHAVNSDDRPRSKLWETIKIAAITTLAGAAAVGIGASVYKFAVRRTRRLLRREEREENQPQPMQQAVGVPHYVYMPPPYSQPWPTMSERDRMPEALREIPNFQPMAAHAAAPQGAPYVAQPTVIPAPPSADPNMRRFMADMTKRLSNIESYLQDEAPDDDDDDDDDDRRGKGKN